MEGGDDSGSEDGGESSNGRKRKAPMEPPTAAEEAATATLMSLPRKLSQKPRDGEEGGSVKSEGSDVDLTTVEGKPPSPTTVAPLRTVCLTSLFRINRSTKLESKHDYRRGTIPGKLLSSCFVCQ